ncbi:MAG TPA: DMT family transporter [Burkholderiales bacterium]
MGPDALLLVITGALLHATWNFFAKKASAGGLRFIWLSGLVSLVAAAPFGWAAWNAQGAPLSTLAWIVIVASAFIHVVYSLVLQHGYRKSDFSVVYPMARGTGPLFSVFGAVLLLGEAPNLPGWLGIGALLVGIFLIADGMRLFSPTPRTLTGVIWGGATGLCIASYTVLDGWAVKDLGIAPVLFYILGLAFRSVMLAPFALSDRGAVAAQWRLNRRFAIVVGLLSPLAYTLVLIAMTRAPLSYVAPVREVSMLVGVFIGGRLLGESLSLPRIAGTLAMVGGVALLAWAG